MAHLRCLRVNQSNNGKCRLEARRYLECRMDKCVISLFPTRTVDLISGLAA